MLVAEKKRHMTQFSLRFLFIVISLIALGGGFVSYLRTEPYGIRRIRQLGGEIYGDYLATIKDWAEPLGFVRLQTIEIISVDNDELSDADLKGLVSFPTLERLSISSSRITDDGIKSIAEMPELTEFGH